MADQTRFAQPFKDFEILERLGSGGMGTVFKARQLSTGRLVALKVLRPSLSRNRRHVERLKREAEISMRLDHPHLVRGLAVGEEGGYHYFAMEFVEGRPLKELLKTWGRFPEAQVVELGRQIASALACAHAHGVVHRDVKPGNVLVDERGFARLSDLGLAKGFEDLSLTRDGATVGTPQYMSPEQARDPAAVDERSDLYSLGATLYHAAVGQPPHTGGSVGEVVHRILHGGPPDFAGLDEELSPGFRLVLRKLLARDPKLRYASAGELVADLERLAAGASPKVDIRALDRAERPRPAWRRFAVAAAVLVAAGLSAYGLLRGSAAGHAQPNAVRGLADLEARLARAAGRRERFALLAAFEPKTRAERLRWTELRAAETAALDRALDEFLAGELGLPAFAAWLDTHGLPAWRRDWFDGEVARRLARRLGFAPDELPDGGEGREGPRSHFLAWRRREEALLEREVRARVRRLRVEWEQRFESEVRPRVTDLMARGRFGAAAALLALWREGPPAPDGRPGPGAAAWPVEGKDAYAAYAAKIDRAARRVLEEASARVEDFAATSGLLAADLERCLELELLAAGERALRTLRGRLEGKLPWQDLPPGVPDPLPGLRRRLVRLERRLRLLERRRDTALFRIVLTGAGRLLARDGYAAGALRLLASFRTKDPELQHRRDRWLDDLGAIDAALAFARETLLAAGAHRSLKLVPRRGAPWIGRLAPGPAPRGLELVQAERKAFEVSDLEPTRLHREIAGLDPNGAARHRLGFGLLLLFCGGDAAEGLELLRLAGRPLEDYLALRARLDEAEAQATRAARARIARWAESAASLIRERRTELARAVIELCERELSGRSGGEPEALQRARALLARVEVFERVLAALPEPWRSAGAVVAGRGGGQGAGLEFRFAAAGAAQRGAGGAAAGGWRWTPAGLEITGAGGGKLALDLPGWPAGGGLRLELDVAVPENGWVDRLDLFAFGSGLQVVQVGRKGIVVGTAGPERFDRALERLLAARPAPKPWFWLPGFRSTLALELSRRREGRRRLRLTSGARLLFEGATRAPARAKARVGLALYGRAAIERILIEDRDRP